MLVGSSFTFTGCDSSSESTDSSNISAEKAQTGSISLSAGTKDSALSKSFRAALGVASDITMVTVDVSSASKTYAKARNLSNGGSGWNVELVDLPLNEELTFTLNGYNSAKEKIFKGVESYTLIQKVTNLGLTMYVLDDGEVLSIPKLSKVNIVNDTQIDFSIADNIDGSIFYTITTDSNGLDVNSSSGTIEVVGGSALLQMPVTPTLSVGTYTHTIVLENSQGSTLESDFMTRVISEVNFSGTPINIAPVVSAISIDRNGDTLHVEADISDDSNISELVYKWSFDGLTFIDDSTNPATLTNFTNAVAGTLTLDVTDAEGASTTVNYAIESNQFPDITAPSIVSTLPTANASDVAVDAPIVIEFNEAVQTTSISNNSIIVSDGIEAVEGVFDINGSSVTFTPNSNLVEDVNYSVTITSDVKDLSGNNLEYQGGLVFEFSTGTAGPVELTFTRDDVNEVVIASNGLMLQDDLTAAGYATGNLIPWIDAVNICEDLTLAGNNDWYLPTIRQLGSILDATPNPSSFLPEFQNITPYNYWSSSEYELDANLAWGIGLGDNLHYDLKIGSKFVRCVRDNN